MQKSKIDVLVIGAGPAGCVSACYLLNKGYDVTIIEKASFPRFVIGESLLPISMEHFEEVGLLDVLNEQGYQIKNGAIFRTSKSRYYIDFSQNYTPGWTWTWQVPREDFDKVIADETERKGVKIKYRSTIKEVQDEENGFSIIVETGGEEKTFSSRFIIDASGGAGVMRNIKSIATALAKDQRRSYFTRVKEGPAEDSEVDRKIYFDVIDQDFWFWAIPFSTGETSLGFVGDEKHFIANGRDLEFNEMLKKTPAFLDRFTNKDYLFDPIKFDNYTLSSEKIVGKNFVLIGNSMGFIDPVFSSGVALATSSSIRAAALVHKHLQGIEVDWNNEYVDWINKGSHVFKTYIDAWYNGSLQDIFFSDNIQEETRKQITSVLAGYVWDESNPFVKNGERLLKTLQKVIKIEERKRVNPKR